MYIHTGNHYFCPITHETNIYPTLFNYGNNWYNYADYSSINKYTSLFNSTPSSNSYGWGYALGNSGYDIYDNIFNFGNSSSLGIGNYGETGNNSYGYTYLLGSGYDIIDNMNKPNNGYYRLGQNMFSPTKANTSGYSYMMGSGYDILDNAIKPDKSAPTYNSNPFSNTQNSKAIQQTSSNNKNQATIQNITTQHASMKTSIPNSIDKKHVTTAEDRKFAKSIADNAGNYIGYNEKDGTFHKFSNSTEWCADFVTYIVKESYLNKGRPVPLGFGSWRCENLKQWAINNDKFLQTAGKSNKADIIVKSVKPGDILILRENGASHTGIVKSINKSTGEFTTIEGNVTDHNGIDSVVENNYTPDNPEISGFIQLV